MGQLQLLGPGQKADATSAKAAQAAPVLPRGPRGTWISEVCNNVVWLEFPTGSVALVLGVK